VKFGVKESTKVNCMPYFTPITAGWDMGPKNGKSYAVFGTKATHGCIPCMIL